MTTTAVIARPRGAHRSIPQHRRPEPLPVAVVGNVVELARLAAPVSLIMARVTLFAGLATAVALAST